ncbi:MAG: hypothetical protein II886_08405 [Prevotella sp.]|nr:hypothetical protein [Prevotella sp.]
MEQELLQKAEELASLLLTPQQIGSLLGLNGDETAEFFNEFKPAGQMYRRVLAEQARELHEKTLRLAQVGSPTAIEQANKWLTAAQISIE